MPRSCLAIPNLVDPRTHAEHDMPAIWRKLRSEDPVHWHPETADGPGFWVVTRYEDIVGILRDTRFTSEKGNVLPTMLHGGDTGAGRMLAVTDGDHHTELRKLLLQAFAPRVLEKVAEEIRVVIRDLMSQAVDRGEIDFALDVASIIPLETICGLLCVPAGDRQEILRLTKSALASESAGTDVSLDLMARNQILIYFSDLVAARRKAPGSDPISLMVTAEVGGRRLSDEDIILNCYSLILGGEQTSRLSMIGAVLALIENPGQWQALRNGDVALDRATEEVLRWTTPTMHFGRTATADVELRERAIAQGDLVTVWFASGNRDEAVFTDPDRFDLARSPNKHLSLGYGRHFCLGAYLGRVEITAMLDCLRTFATRVELAGTPRRIYSNCLSGLSTLPVVLQRA
jgi:cytochrome P450